MRPHASFRFCPRCAVAVDGATGASPFECRACGFVYYFNPAVSVAALIERDDGRVLFIRRAHDPAKGALALVGGFVDPDETLEDALRREVQEEVALELSSVTYLASFTNDYPYRGLDYPVADLVFVAQTGNPEAATALDAVASLTWLDPAAVDPSDIAFESMRQAIRLYLAARSPPD